jgi:hypothetical protein
VAPNLYSISVLPAFRPSDEADFIRVMEKALGL